MLANVQYLCLPFLRLFFTLPNALRDVLNLWHVAAHRKSVYTYRKLWRAWRNPLRLVADMSNLVPRACDPREGTWGSGIIRCRKPGILAKTELRIPYQRPIRFLLETDYPRASRSFPRIAGSGNEIGHVGDVVFEPAFPLRRRAIMPVTPATNRCWVFSYTLGRPSDSRRLHGLKTVHININYFYNKSDHTKIYVYFIRHPQMSHRRKTGL
jgi:hypothetical protein